MPRKVSIGTELNAMLATGFCHELAVAACSSHVEEILSRFYEVEDTKVLELLFAEPETCRPQARNLKPKSHPILDVSG